MNVFDYLFEHSSHLKKDFLLGNKEQVSYRSLYRDAHHLAVVLKAGYGEGNNMLLCSPNSVFFLTAYLAIMKSGNVCVPLNPTIEESNLKYITDLCGAKTAFVADSLRNEKWKVVNEVHYELPESGEAFSNGDPGELPAFDSERLAEIIFTSGSTGEPKGVMITHGNIIANTDSIIAYLGLTDRDVIEVVLPFYYCYGLSLLHTHLRVGGSAVFNNSFMFLGSVIRDLNIYRCTGFAGVPSHFQILMRKTKTFKSTSFPHLKYVTQAGGKLHTAFIEEFVESFPEVSFYVMYGQTEATARLSYLPPEKVLDKLGSMGRAIPGVELRIVDEQGEEITATGVVGEVVARGDNIMKGYIGDEKSTGETLRNGWLHTGDLASMDEEGYFFLTARSKEIIKVGGRRISPKEIEEVIVTMPGVIDCNISGIHDDFLGEALKAEIVVTRQDDHPLDEAMVKAFCASNLAQEKVPQVVVFTTHIDIAATGKKVKKKSPD